MKRVELQGMVRWSGAAEPKARTDSGNTQLYGVAPWARYNGSDITEVGSGAVAVCACVAARRLEGGQKVRTQLRGVYPRCGQLWGRGLRITTNARRPSGGGESGWGDGERRWVMDGDGRGNHG
jgi:hypothetical protein